MVSKTVTVKNINGIQCRPSTHIYKEAVKYSSTLTSTAPAGNKAGLKSMIEIITLALRCGDEVIIEAHGPDEAEALEALCRCFEAEYDYPE